MSHARFIVGDVFDVLASMPDQSVDLVLTSPPFLALRSYLPADHPDKGKEIGSEATPGDFIDTLLDVTEACARVLTPHGSICIELGDTYSGSGGAGGDYNENGLREGQEKWISQSARIAALNSASGSDSDAATSAASGSRKSSTNRTDEESRRGVDARNRGNTSRGTGGQGWPLAKSLCLIPESYRWALVYGRNPFNGRETEPWRARNVVRWCRPNPPVGALGDKFRPGTSDMVVACKSGSRWFDLDAVRTEGVEPGAVKHKLKDHSAANPRSGWATDNEYIRQNPNGAPPLDHWLISTEPYAGSHYACWPTALLTRPIESMVPRRVCRTCGKPSERIVDVVKDRKPRPNGGGGFGRLADDTTTTTTTGWTDCGHGTWRPGVVLDPFAGSGTTLAVATGHGRDAIGIDLDERNADLARERVGMFLDVEHFADQAAQ